MTDAATELEQARPELLNRLRRIEGQARGIQRMLEEGRTCEEIITQVSALKAAVGQVGMTMIGCVLEQSLRESLQQGQDTSAAVAKAKKLLSQL
jgi:DNA-binding FrmR family transcriptional regulator